MHILAWFSVQILLMPGWKLNLCHLAASKEAKPSKAGRRGRARCRCCCFVRRQLHQQWLQLPENKQIRGHLIYPDTLKNPTNPTNKGFLFQLTSVLTCKPLRSLEAAEQEARPIWHPQLPRILMFVPRLSSSHQSSRYFKFSSRLPVYNQCQDKVRNQSTSPPRPFFTARCTTSQRVNCWFSRNSGE